MERGGGVHRCLSVLLVVSVGERAGWLTGWLADWLAGCLFCLVLFGLVYLLGSCGGIEAGLPLAVPSGTNNS